MQVKSVMFKAIAQHRLAAVNGTSGEYGAQVGRLRLANNILEDAKKKFIKSVPQELQTAFANLQAVCHLKISNLTLCSKL
jgi:hypothetical protein